MRDDSSRLRDAFGSWLPARFGLAGPGHELRARHVSLGTFCHTSAALDKCGLRRWTGPFDWIFSTPGLATHCLQDDFATLLDPGELLSVPSDQLAAGAKRQCRHPAYEARYSLPILFNHHDPASVTSDRDRLVRAVDRFRTTLATGGDNIFYMMSEVAWPGEDIDALADQLATYRARNTLVVLTASNGADAVSWRETDATATRCRVISVEVGNGSRSLGLRFADEADNHRLAGIIQEAAGRVQRDAR